MSQEAELQKVKDLLDMGFIHDEEYERRIKEILGNDPIPPAFRIGNTANAVDPFEEERRRQEEEERIRREMEEEERRLIEEERRLIEEEELMRRQMEEQIRLEQEMLARENIMRAQLQGRKEELERRKREEEERALREAEEWAKREAEWAKKEAEERAKREVEEMARQQFKQIQPSTNNTSNSNKPMSAEERLKAIEERQARDKLKREAEIDEERKREDERRAREGKSYPYYDYSASYEPMETPKFDPNATYSTPEYYAPTGIKLYPIYPPGYFSTVHPFAFIAANKENPSDNSAINAKIAEIKRIIGQSQKNPATNWEEQRREQEALYQNQMEKARQEALQRHIASAEKKPIPPKVDDGIDVNSLPKPTVQKIPPRKWDDSNEPYEAPKYILPSNPRGVIVMQRSEGSVCQTKELDAPTRASIFKMFEMTDGRLINVQTGEEFIGETVPSGCYRLERKLDMQFYRSMGAMPLYSSVYSNFNSGGRNSFNLQYERVPSAITDKRNTYYHEDVVFSYGNVRTTGTVHSHSYNESVRPPAPPGNSYSNYSTTPLAVDPNWFKRFREENVKTDYVVCIRNVFRKAGKEPPLRLHRALKDSLDNSKCVVCKQFAQDMLCDAHKDERFAELMKSVGSSGNFAEIFGVSTEPTPIEEEVESPIYYKNHGEVMAHDNDLFKAYIDFSDPNLQPKWQLNGILAERFNRIKENARMSYDMMMNDDYLVHKPGSEQAHLYD